MIGKWENAREDLLKVNPRYWCKAFFRTYPQCDANHNNLNEAFNGVKPVLEARQKSIYSMLEDIRRYIMQRFVDKRRFVSRWEGDYGKIILDKVVI